MRQPWRDVRPSMPVVGGTDGGCGPAIVDAVGTDVIIGVGGAIQGHPSRPPAPGVRAAIDDAIAGRGVAARRDRRPMSEPMLRFAAS
jgi:ribulose 1,5-bisphosphate carboxylase large subunit-like protein